jgi:pimeloyl-ACP methyl ester carboxylesterase
MPEQKAHAVGPARIEIAYERLGAEQDPPVLLVMGLGAQLIHWPDGFCSALVGRGLHVIRFDNRDAGLSTHFPSAPPPNFQAALLGDGSSASYRLSAMAADTVGLLDALGLPSAHVVGASMGGMIAQTIAIEHPTRIRSLTSIMSTTGDRSVGQPRPEGMRALVGAPATNREDVIARVVEIARIIGSPQFPVDEDFVRERAARAYDRNYDPVGVARQAVATLASGDRTPRLRELDVPSLVIHGTDDVVCDVSGGRATASAIPGAELVVIEGMGHNLPPGLWADLADRIHGLVKRVERTSYSATQLR